MGWFVGDDNNTSSLEESQLKNLEELAERGSGSSLNIVVQMDRGTKLSRYLRNSYSDPNYSGAKRYVVERNKFVVHQKPGEVNMGDPEQLLDFMAWTAENYPARNYILIVNAHGSGMLSWRGTGSVNDSVPGRVDLGLGRYVGYDDTDKDCLTIFELSQVFKNFAEKHNGGKKLDMFAADACNAAGVEALYQFRDGLDFLVASPATVPGHGFRYTAIVDAVYRNPQITPQEMGAVITKSFIDRAGGGNLLGCFRTEAAAELADSVSSMAREMFRAHQETRDGSLSGLTGYSDDKYWDLDRVAKAIVNGRAGFSSASNRQALRDAAGRVVKAMKWTRTSLWYSGKYNHEENGGLSIFWPGKEKYKKYRAFYKATDFAKAVTWDEYLDWRELGIQ